MLWGKSRDGNHAPFLYDTTRGATKYLRSDVNAGQVTLATALTGFTTTGFSLGSHVGLNDDVPNVAWSFKKIPGFFDFVTWDGNGSTRTISHSLEAVPGLILIKRTDGSADWIVYHNSIGAEKVLFLNEGDKEYDNSTYFNDTKPTSTVFTVNDSSTVNNNGSSYVAYLFATGDTGLRNSVEFDGNDYLTYADDPAWQLGTGDWTMECFWKSGSGNTGNYQQLCGTQAVFAANNGIWRVGTRTNSNQIYFSRADGSGFEEPTWDVDVNDEAWHHLAFTRASDHIYCWVDGVQRTNTGESNNIGATMTTSNSFRIAHNARDGTYNTGKISNLRIVKGKAVYSNGSNFTTPTEPLSTVSGTIFLGCDASSIASSSLSAKIPTATGDPTVSTDNPFTTEAAGAVFGKSGNNAIIKMGSYTGNASSTGPEINLGWEPAWLLFKNSTADNRDWKVLDCMRGIVTGEDDAVVVMNGYATETDESVVDLTSTGFKITNSNAHYNENGEVIIYMAIRRPDGTVGKPATAGTEVFTPVKGSSGAPLFVTPHTVDFHFAKDWDVVKDWNVSSRLTQGKRLETNTNIIEDTNQYQVGDYQTGWGSYTGGDGSRMGYNFKRHAGFDVVTYKGSEIVSHNLGVRPEMVWIKQRDGSTRDWAVACPDILGINANTLALNQDYATGTSNVNVFHTSAAAQTATQVRLHGNENGVSSTSSNYLMLLFASVSGISKIGTYSGDSGSVTVTCGFQPRFILLKVTNTTEDWIVFDTVMGIASGNDTRLRLNRDGAAVSTSDWVDLTSDGFIVNNTGSSGTNTDGNTYLYYAHA